MNGPFKNGPLRIVYQLINCAQRRNLIDLKCSGFIIQIWHVYELILIIQLHLNENLLHQLWSTGWKG